MRIEAGESYVTEFGYIVGPIMAEGPFFTDSKGGPKWGAQGTAITHPKGDIIEIFRIEEGGYYRDQSGTIFGPMKIRDDIAFCKDHPFRWRLDGRSLPAGQPARRSLYSVEKVKPKLKVEPGKRYWRSDGKITEPLISPSGPRAAVEEPDGVTYDLEGNLSPPVPGRSLRLVREYVPPVEVFKDYRVRTSEFSGMTVTDTPGSGCITVIIPPTEADADTLRVWAAVMLDMAATLDKVQ